MVDEGEAHAIFVADFGDCEADARGGARDEGCITCFEHGVERHGWRLGCGRGGVGLGVFGGEKSAGGFKWRRGIPSLATICIENIVPTLFGVR